MNLHPSVTEALATFNTEYELVPGVLHYHQEGRTASWVVVSKGYQLNPYSSIEEVELLCKRKVLIGYGYTQLEAKAQGLGFLLATELLERDYVQSETEGTYIYPEMNLVWVRPKGFLFTIEEYIQWLRDAASKLNSEAHHMEAAFLSNW